MEQLDGVHDWRFWVGGTGRILLAIGLLMFGFVAYQLWGTGIEYRQHQGDLAKQFRSTQEQLLGTSGASTDTLAPDDTIEQTADTGLALPDGSGSGVLVTPTTFPGEGKKLTRWPKPAPGEAIAIISIPKIHKRVYAVSGVGTKDLKKGLGHYPRTPFPGQLGNSAFAGHRTTFGGPLFDIDQLVIGDDIVVDTLTNQRYVYVVSSLPRVVSATAGSVIETTDRSLATLTLTSCHPKYSARQRIVVVATLDQARSGPVQPPSVDPTPTTTTPTGTAPTATTATTATTTVLTATSGATTTVATTAPTTSATSDSSTPDTVSPDNIVGGEPQLSHGWFTDSAAWWHVVGWGVLEAAIVIGGWVLAKRTRRRWLGLAVAAVPFLVVLYFVYQNVNRLLPADL
jgi:sortase A